MRRAGAGGNGIRYRYTRDVARPALLIAALLLVAGAIFIGQGLGMLRGSSFMVDDRRWAWIGAAMVIAGVGLAVLARRRPA